MRLVSCGDREAASITAEAGATAERLRSEGESLRAEAQAVYDRAKEESDHLRNWQPPITAASAW